MQGNTTLKSRNIVSSKTKIKRATRLQKYSSAPNFKAYKANGHWVVGRASLGLGLGVVAAVTMMSPGQQASADSTSPNAGSAGAEQIATTAPEATTDTSQGVNVEVPHDQVDKSVDAAKNAGVDVTQEQSTDQTVSGNESDSTQKDITADYNNQSKNIDEVTQQQIKNTEENNQAQASTAEAEANAGKKLDDLNDKTNQIAKDAEAAGIPANVGSENVNPDYVPDDNTNADTQAKTTEHNINAINDAVQTVVDKQTAINDQASKDIADYVAAMAQYNEKKTGSMSGLTLDNGNWHGYYTPDLRVDLTWEFNPSDNTVTVHITNVYYDARTDLVTKHGAGYNDVVTLQTGNGGGNITGATSGGVVGSGGHGGADTAFNTSSILDTIQNSSDGTLVFAADKQNATDETHQTGVMNATYTVGANPDGTFTLLTFGRRGVGYDANGNAFSDWQWNQKIIIPAPAVKPTMPQINLTTYQSPITVKPAKIKNLSTSYQLHNLVVQPQSVKDDDVNGDSISDSGKTVDKGDTIDYSLSNDDLPANRTDDVKNYSITDPLDKNVHTTLSEVQASLNNTGQSSYWTATVSGGDEHGGQTVTYTATDKLLELMNSDKTKSFKIPAPILPAHITADNVSVNNQFTTTVNDYHVTSNVVPNSTPDPKPTKEDLNEKGVDIDNKTVLPGTTNVYELGWDLDQYKGITASKDAINKGFLYVDDYPEDALNVDTSKFTMTDSNGKAVEGVTVKVFNSLSDAPAWVQALMKTNSINPSGAFIAFMSDDAQAFYEKYVLTGTNITIMAPMTVKDTFQGDYKNTAYQFDFGNGYTTQTVHNNVPPMNATKSVENLDNTDINNGSINVGDIFKYVLHSPDIPATNDGLGEPLYQAGGYDALDATYDEYTGQYRITNTVDIELQTKPSDSSQTALWNELKGMSVNGVIPAGTDLSKYITVTYGNYALKHDSTFVHDVVTPEGKIYKAGENVPTGTTIKDVFSWEFTQDFLDQLLTTSGLKYDVEIQAKRIKATGDGYVENQGTFSFNNVEYHTDTVKTKTPEPEIPGTPGNPVNPDNPSTPATSIPAAASVTPETAVQQAGILPETGTNNTWEISAIGLILLGLVGATKAFPLKKREV